MRVFTVGLLLFVISPSAAGAQSLPPAIARLDFAASIGSFSAEHPAVSPYDDWSHSLFRGLTSGLYWTDHLKTELDVAWAGTGEAYGIELVQIPGRAAFTQVGVEHYFRSVTVSATQVYQFGRNAYVHPFIAGGVDVERERHEIERREQTLRSFDRGQSTDTFVIPALVRTETAIVARPFAAAGLKAYFTERAFIRTDLKLNFRRDVDRVIWRLGVGVDF
jgi:hypothetical protein